MGKRTVGSGRGAVFAGGKVYLEGATIPDDVEVGAHVFEDIDPVEGNVTVEPVRAITVDADSGSSGSDAASGTVDEVLARVGDDPDAAREALEAEQAKSKPRTSLVEKLQAVADSGSSGS